MKLFIKGLLLIFITLFLQSNIGASQPKSSTTTVSTLQEALFNVRKAIINFPADDSMSAQIYEKEKAVVLVQCAKVLYDNAHEQILQGLQEIDKRIAYWRYQKNHQWAYFLMKNPLKWVAGPNQDAEIEHNIEQLQSHQGELYVLLGQLAEHGTIYDREFKTVFVADYTKAYAWIDGLLDLLARIKIATQNRESMSPFVARATLLKLKLTKVRGFKHDILMQMPQTKIPAHFERNWLMYGALAFLFGYGYKNISGEQIVSSFDAVKKNFNNYIMDPIQNIVKDVFVGGVHKIDGELLVPQEDINVAKESIKKFINSLSVKEESFTGRGDISREQKAMMLEDIALGKSDSFQAFMDNLASGWSPKKAVEATALFYKLLALQAGGRVQTQLSDIQRQYIGVGKIAVLTPAILSGWFAFKGYQAFVAKDYTQIRRALVDINYLFVDTTKPLDDEGYGKMIYLLYNLKKQAEKDVPLASRGDFIEDLNKIESKEFGVAAKRAIVEDMFRKYSFLKLG